MVTVTVHLDERLAEAIRSLAVSQKRSENEIVHEALAAYTQTAARPLPLGLGKYRSGRSDVSENAENLLNEAAREGQWH